MIEVRIGKHRTEIASNWEEATGNQLLYFCYLRRKNFNRDEILTRTTYMWSKFKPWVYFKMNAVQRVSLQQKLDWVFESAPPSKQCIPVYRYHFRKWYGPGDKLRHVLVKEWMIADAGMTKWFKSQDERSLHEAIACLYRPARSIANEDMREVFDWERCRLRAEDVALWPAHVKDAIALNYCGMRMGLEKDFPHVFNGEKTSRKNFGIPGMLHDMAGPETGTIKDLEGWKIRDLLFIAEKNEVRRIENESQK